MDVIDCLVDSEGTYLGTGTDRDGAEFRGELQIHRAVDGAGVSMLYTATGEDETPLHQEQMLVGYTREGTLYLWGLDSATERIRQRALREAIEIDGCERIRFGAGATDDDSTYREEILFELEGDDVRIEFARGEPGQRLEVYSAARLVPEAYYSLQRDSTTDDVAYRELEDYPDRQLLEEIYEVVDRLDSSDDLGPLADRAFWQRRRVHLAIAEVDGAPVAVRAAYLEQDRRVVCETVGVAPEFRGRGIGKELLVRQLRWARTVDGRIMRVAVPNSARDSIVRHLQHGFEIVDTKPENGGTRVVLAYDLSGRLA